MKYIVTIVLLMLSVFNAFSQDSLLAQAQEAKKNGDYQKAYDLFKEAGNIFLEQKVLLSYVETHLEMIDCQLLIGDPFQAKSLAENTLNYIQSELNESYILQARSQTLLGLNLLNLGRGDEALENLLQAEILFGQGETVEKSNCFNALGLTYWNNGNKELALQYHEQALGIRMALIGRDALEVGDSFNNLGLVYQQEEPLQALIYFHRAKKIYEDRLEKDDRKTALVLTNMAFANASQENFDEAFALLNQVKSIYDRKYLENHPNKAFILSSIGTVYEQKGELTQALFKQNEALQMYLALFGKKHPDVANTYFLIGRIHQGNSDFKSAVEFYQQSIFSNFAIQNFDGLYDLPKLENHFNADILLSSLQAKAIALEALHYKKTLNTRDLKSSIETYELCDELISIVRKQRLSAQDKLRLGAIAKEVYDNGIRLSLILSEQSVNKKKYLETAFEFCERSKSSVLLEAITETKAKRFSGISPHLLTLEDSLKDEISYIEQKLAQPDNSDEQILKDLLFTYQNEYRSFISKLEVEYPEYYNLKYSHTLATVDEIQNKLQESFAMISYFIGADQIFIFVVTKKNIKAHIMPKSESFEEQSVSIRNAIKYNITSVFMDSAKGLYDQLIPNLPSSIRELIILPDGILGTIPFETLINSESDNITYADAPYLIRAYNISYDYSATLFTQRASESNITGASILLVAPIEFENNEVRMAPLPGSKKEIMEIRYLFMGTESRPTIQSGRNASESNLKLEDLGKYKYLHFATHGLVNESQPALSRIFLRPDQEEDGSLYAGEIYNLKINADLVTLSACETGLGKVAKGEGIVGLSRALQYAGAKNIIVSLWQVADASTSQMMIEFYKYNLNNDHHGYNSALRQAKLSLLNSAEYNRPYFWAPFILVGM